MERFIRHLMTPYLLIMVAMVTRSSPTGNSNEVFISLRNRNINIITLQCQRIRDGQHPAVTVFFRNGEIYLDNVGIGMIKFLLTHELEGEFTCGQRTENNEVVGVSSHKVALIPYPSDEVSSSQFSANTGDNATINCSIVPGYFSRNYSVWWRNASNPSQVFYERSRFEMRQLSSRYHFNNETLALIIDGARPSDAASQYTCEVFVTIDMQDMWYPEVNQTLSVFEAPAFVMTPSPITVTENNTHNATFHCKVRSSPNPSAVTWSHHTSTGEVRISTVGCRDSHYCLTSRRVETLGGFQVNSQLTIIGVNSRDTGMVECHASYSTLGDSSSVSVPTTLTVIGRPTKLVVISTEPIGYLIDVTLSRSLPVPVRVDLWFSNADDPSKEERSLEDEYFYNTTHLTAHRNRIPFRRFRVHVRILYGDDVTAGVFKNSSTIYERGLHAKTKLWITGSSLSGFFAFISTALLIIIAILVTQLCNVRDIAHRTGMRNADTASLGEPSAETKLVEEGETEYSRSLSNGHRCNGPASCGEQREARIAEDGAPLERSWRDRLRCCFRFRSWNKQGFSEREAKVFISNLKGIVKFGRSDTNIRKLLNAPGARDRIWPLREEDTYSNDS